MPENKITANLSKEQKIGFVLLLVFAVLAIGLGVLQIRNTMYGPFALKNSVPSTLKNSVDNVNALQYRDTDYDGLNDFKELYVYQTSPYLEDTDSDGVDDKTEVGRGSNPSCAEGKNCSTVTVSNTALGTQTTSTLVGGVTAPTSTPVSLDQMLNDPTQLRAALINSGVDASLLQQVSDSELMTLVQSVMSPASNTSNYSLTTSTN